MRTAQPGDRVLIHYVKRLQDGGVASSRAHAPLELTVGVDHPLLPGLGSALVGMAPGTSITVHVPAERAYGPSDPARVRRWPCGRFPKGQAIPVGKWVRILSRQGRPRMVRILEVRGDTIVVDANRRGAGQALELRVELVGIRHAPDVGPGPRQP
jgi:FKBP-type peptidyl-prolyl cis-trans isomerase 2